MITNRHRWSAEEIILAYWGQSHVEWAFKNIKNPFHLEADLVVDIRRVLNEVTNLKGVDWMEVVA